MVDLSAIVPGVTVAKNEGYKTIISIRGIGNETNQNAIAAPSVFSLDGVLTASPFSLLTDFVDIDRIEVIRESTRNIVWTKLYCWSNKRGDKSPFA